MIFKFLEAGARCPATGEAWPLGEWVERGSRLDPAGLGLVLQPREALAGWACKELYRAEASGVRRHDDAIIAERARLIAIVPEWSELAVELAKLAHERANAMQSEIGRIAEYREDLTAMTQWGMHAGILFVSALVAATAADPDGARPLVRREAFLRERAWQSAWLAEHLPAFESL